MTYAAGMVMPEGFASHNYFEQRHCLPAIRVLPNEYMVSRDNVVLTTVLGSCVSACVRDPVAGIGGINHFMLPGAGVTSPETGSLRYGANAMDRLLEALDAGGAQRDRLEVKLFGGATMITDLKMARVGEANVEFVLAYVQAAGLSVLAQDMKDRFARQLHYFPATGRALIKRLRGSSAGVARQERAIADTLGSTAPGQRTLGPVRAADANGPLEFAP